MQGISRRSPLAGGSLPALWLLIVLVLGLAQAGLTQPTDQPVRTPAEAGAQEQKDSPAPTAAKQVDPDPAPQEQDAPAAKDSVREKSQDAAKAAVKDQPAETAPATDAAPAKPPAPGRESAPGKDAAKEKEVAPAKEAIQPDKAAKGAHAPTRDDPRKDTNKDASASQQAQTSPAPQAQPVPAEGAAQPAPTEAEEEDQLWKFIQQRYAEEVAGLTASAQALTDGLDVRLKAARQQATEIDRRFERIKAQQGVADGSPWEMRAVLRAAQRLEQSAQKTFAPHLDQIAELARVEQKLTELETEFKDQLKENAYPELTVPLTAFLQDVQKARNRLKGLGRRLATGLAPVRDVQDRVSKQRARLEESLPTIWRSFFFEPGPSLVDPAAWKQFIEEGRRWGQGLTQQTLSFTKADRGELRAAGLKAAVYAPLLAGAALWLLRLLSRRQPDLAALAEWRAARSAAVILSLGAAILLAAVAAQSDRLASLIALGQILAGLGLALVAWLARSRLLPAGWRDQAANPLSPLWGLFSLGLLLQTLAVPGPALAPIWFAALLLAGWRLTRQARRPSAGLDRVLNVLSRTIILSLAAMTFLGLGHLSILIAAVWFLICLAGAIGLTVSALLGNWRVSRGEDGAGQFIEGLVHGLGFPAIVLGLAALIVGWLAAHLGGEVFLDQAAALQIGWGAFSLNLFKLVLVFTLFFVTRSAVFVSGSALRQLPGRWPGFDRGAADSLQTVSAYALWAAFALTALYLLGVDLASLAVIAGGLSVGIGFGMQNIVNNFVSGLILLFGRAVQAGDVIQVGDIQGVVQKVQIRNAVVQTFDNATVFVPNSDLLTNNLINWSHKDPRVRREVTVGVAYGSDTKLVTRLLEEAARQHPNVLAEPAPDVLFKDFGSSTLDFVLRFWVVHVDKALSTTSEVRYAVERTFRKHGVEIAYPQQELHIRTAPALEGFLRGMAGDDRLETTAKDLPRPAASGTE